MRGFRSILSAAVIVAVALATAAIESTRVVSAETPDTQATAETPPTPPASLATPGNPQTLSTTGAKAIPTPPPGTYGIVAEADGAGGIFRDTDSEAEAWLGSEGVGAKGFGSIAGGYFKDSDGTGLAYIGYVDTGIKAYGTWMGGNFNVVGASGRAFVANWHTGIKAYGDEMGGRFEDLDQSGYALVGTGDTGIEAFGDVAGAYFKDRDGTGIAWAGYGDRGIEAEGSVMGGYFKVTDGYGSGWAEVGVGDYGIQAFGNDAGAYFKDRDGTGIARAGYGDRGIDAEGSEMGGYFKVTDGYGSGYAEVGIADHGIQAFGNDAGGEFKDSDGTGLAKAGWGDRGIDAEGSEMGGHFKDTDGTGYSYVGNGDRGIVATGDEAGGIFHDLDDSGYSNVGYGDRGIEAYGDDMGGYFEETAGTGYAHLGVGNRGIEGFGANVGGYFENTDSGAWVSAAFGTTKISGTGTVNFVQNHPYDSSSVIVYTAPEGDEVATYTRGTATLVNGEASVQLGETFKWVTNPDIGLTSYLTPVGNWCDLYVLERNTDQITVRSRDGLDCTFDFLVYGLRIGFEETSLVKEKDQEAYIPSMSSHRDLYQRRPDLRRYNSLERFKSMSPMVTTDNDFAMGRAEALRDAIIEFDPAVHELSRYARRPTALESAATSMANVDTPTPDHRRMPSVIPDTPTTGGPQIVGSSTIPVDENGIVYAASFRPSSGDIANLLQVSEPVEPGDVLTMDRERPGTMRRAVTEADAGVVGVVTRTPGVVLGSQPGTETQAAAVAFSGIALCKVDAGFGAIYPGDLLVTSPTPGHAMRANAPLPGTIVGKALEELPDDTGTIRVLVMLR